MRATALLLVLALLPGCLAEPAGPPPELALDQVAGDVSSLGRELAQRRADRDQPPAERQGPAQPGPQAVVRREPPGPRPPDQQAAARAANPYAVVTWPRAVGADRRPAGPPLPGPPAAPPATLTVCDGGAPLSDAGGAEPAFPILLPEYGQPLTVDPAGPARAGGAAHPRRGEGYGTLRFGAAGAADLVDPAGQALGRLLILAGARLRARASPAGGGQEADLVFEDGTVARRVPLGAFTAEVPAP